MSEGSAEDAPRFTLAGWIDACISWHAQGLRPTKVYLTPDVMHLLWKDAVGHLSLSSQGLECVSSNAVALQTLRDPVSGLDIPVEVGERVGIKMRVTDGRTMVAL
jgi:hypothetical protein